MSDTLKTKKHWKLCMVCHGYGQVLRAPSRKRLKAFRETFGDDANPNVLTSNYDVCPNCTGSGLTPSESLTPINHNLPRVAIIGGGIGGAALAVACLHRGVPFDLYERDESFDARSQGYGLTLQQASKAIRGLGIINLPDGITSTRHVVHNQDGRIIGEWGLRKWKKKLFEKTKKRKNIHVARQTLRAKIFKQLHDSEHVHWGHRLLEYTQDQDGRYSLNLKTPEGALTKKADLIVGADGFRSTIRQSIISNEQSPLQYLDCFVMLGICPLKNLDNVHSPLLDSATVFQTVNGHDRIYMMPYDQDTIMWQLSFPYTEAASIELNKKGPQAMKEEALKRLNDWHSPIPEILQATEVDAITGYPVYDRDILDQSFLKDVGNITLVGDAAHPMSPFKGQGANQALLDALNLARIITTQCEDAEWKKTGLRDLILNQFEQDMIKRTTPKVRGSAHAAKVLHTEAVLHGGDEPRGRVIE